MSDGSIGIALFTIVVAVFLALLVMLALGKGGERYQGTCNQCHAARTR